MAYDVIPLDPVVKGAKKILKPKELKEAIEIVKKLKHWPAEEVREELSVSNCNDWKEARLSSSTWTKKWLRVMFWVCDEHKRIFVLDVFWKDQNKLSVVQIERSRMRLRRVREQIGC